MNTSLSAPMQRAMAARVAYFERGQAPKGMIDSAIYRSWERCVAASRDATEGVEFSPLLIGDIRRLIDGNAGFLAAAEQPLEELTRAVSGVGYAVLLTDERGFALSIAGGLSQSSPLMRRAFRQGVDLSEQAIGTSAMACALNERRAVRVFGPEHFFSANQSFHCAAAPIIGPDGSLLGAVDITRDTPQPDFGALALVSQCAQAIERELFKQLPSYLTIDLTWTPAYGGGQRDLILAFGPDGELLGLNENAKISFGISDWMERSHFEDIFDGTFGDVASHLGAMADPMPIRLRSGLSLFASNACAKGRGRGSARRSVCSREINQYPVIGHDGQEFGDARINARIEQAAKALVHLPVLLTGETGVGKEVVARTLHNLSGRRNGPFIAINCAAIPESLIEGELFGHREGAYTGAKRGGNPGLIEQAHGGTLFLDEIGDMPSQLQSRLLRVLETREVVRLGAAKGRQVDFHLICATLRPLEHFMGSGRFREDLFYRINGYRVDIPPVRERSHVDRLIQSILDDVSKGTRAMEDEVVAALVAQRWPGNVREIKYCLTRTHSLAEPGRSLKAADFTDLLLAPPSVSGLVPSSNGEDGGLLSTMEADAIKKALVSTGHDIRRAAKILGISRATLYRRLKLSKG